MTMTFNYSFLTDLADHEIKQFFININIIIIIIIIKIIHFFSNKISK